MAASHFFIGLSAGIAILAVPVLTLTPGSSVPQHVIDWIEGPTSQQSVAVNTVDSAVNRPLHGYQPGDPTPSADLVPTIEPFAEPTAAPTQVPPPAPQVPAPALANLRWAGTGVIHSNGVPVYVRRVPGVDSGADPQIADGSPVLISAGQPLTVGNQQWRAVKGLNGVVGWIPTSQLAVDGQAPPAQPILVATTHTAIATTAGTSTSTSNSSVSSTSMPTPAAPTQRAAIAFTDGTGVVLRNSPNDADRSRTGLMEGSRVTILAVATDWVQVRADNGATGWVPARYIAATAA
jgi:SH3-like domain-containing protein